MGFLTDGVQEGVLIGHKYLQERSVNYLKRCLTLQVFHWKLERHIIALLINIFMENCHDGEAHTGNLKPDK